MPTNKGKGFTKTELAMVFVIVLILLAIGVPAFAPALHTALRAKDKGNAVNLQTAIISYNTDFGAMPIPIGGKISPPGVLSLGILPEMDPSGTPLPGTAHLFQGLCGNVNPYSGVATSVAVTGLNARNVQYLILSKEQVDKDGILIQSFKSSTEADTYFGIMVDTQYNNTLKGLPDPSTGTFTLTVNDIAAIWCNNDQPFTTPNIRWSTTY